MPMLSLAERAQRVCLLLETLNDPIPPPRGALIPDSGPSPSRYVPCETCRRRGEVRVRGGWTLCLVCDGIGWKRREGAAPWDAYLEMPIEDAATLPRALPPSRARSDGDPDAYPGQSLRARYDREGSYGAVRVHLEWLGHEHPFRYGLVNRVLVNHEPFKLEPAAGMQLRIGVVLIARRMPRVRVPGWLIEKTEADRRRDTIESLAAKGMRAGEIARHLGVSKESVARKLKRDRVGSRRVGIPLAAM
jgi:hypothetical protein